MKLTKHERQILIEIFKSSNGLFIFTLHRQLNLAPKELFTAIEKLESHDLLYINEDRVIITKTGNEYAVKTTLKTIIDDDKQRVIKENFIGKRININEFYIPQNFEK